MQQSDNFEVRTSYIRMFPSESSGDEYRIHTVEERSCAPIEVQMMVNGQMLDMEIAAVSVISDKTRREFFPTEKLHKSKVMLKTYTDEPMKVMGVQKAKLALIVVDGSGPNLFGRNWMKYIRLDWAKISPVRIQPSSRHSVLIEQFGSLFREGLGKIELRCMYRPRQL